jgi:sugar lactone lactonase YvrE
MRSARQLSLPLGYALLLAFQLPLAASAADTSATESTGTATGRGTPAVVPPLLHAVLETDVRSLQRLLDAGADVNIVERLPAEALGRSAGALQGRAGVTLTPLFAAVLTRNLAVVESLLARDADPNLAADAGMTPLLLAVERGDQAIAERLIAAGADVNARDDADNTPLMTAVKRSDLPLVELLLAHGVDLDAPDDRGVTPLRAAIEIPDTKLADLLASHGASVEPAGEAEGPNAPIDIRGFDARLDASAVDKPWRAAALGIAIDSKAGKIYWTEYETGRVRRANLDGSEVETLILADGPVGIALDPDAGRIYWTTDGPYPWRIQYAALDGSGVRDLLSGRFLNRPTDIVLQLNPEKKLFWGETVAGRIRSANLDGTAIEDIVSSGLGVEDRAGSEVTAVYGMALDPKKRALYWSELTNGLIQRRGIADGDDRIWRDRSGGVSSPVGLAVDVVERKLYWADQGSTTLQRADLDGGNLETLMTRAQGLARPWALALDHERRKVYWTDIASDTIRRADVDGGHAELVVRLHPTDRIGRAKEALSCARPPTDYAKYLLVPVEICLDTVGAVKAVKSGAAEAEVAAAMCAIQLLRWDDRANPAATVAAELAFELEERCKTALDATQRREIIRQAGRHAILFLVRRYARAREWLEEVRPFIAALPSSQLPSSRVDDALAALDSIDAAIAALPRSPQTTASPGLPASGQISSYRAATASDATGFEAVADDGAVRAGRELRYIDNGDGTMRDRTTGLMWEKKCDCPGDLHHYHREHHWSDGDALTIWDWLDAVNSEGGTGFAGHRDWRIPNVKELHSLVDYERFNPAAPAAFDAAACGLGCTDLGKVTCSCTESNAYWTSTTFAEDSTLAFTVGFNIGLIGEISKQAGLPVRAVRGGTVENGKQE